MRNPTLLIGHAPEVLATLPESSVDLVLTHPPTYGQSDYGPQPTWDSGAVEALGTEATAYDYCEHVVEVMRACQRVVKFGGLVMLVTEDNDRQWEMVHPEGDYTRWTYQWVSRGRYNQIPYHLACLMSESYNYKGEVIWHVGQPGVSQPGHILRRHHTIQVWGLADSRLPGSLNSVVTVPQTAIPTARWLPLPAPLVRLLIEAACPPGGTVLDPMCGWGTVPLQAKYLNRRGIGIDLEGEDATRFAGRA
jgi:DNA modification methylase